MSDARTPGWPDDAFERCHDLTPDQHAQIACALLDSNVVAAASEAAWNGEPPHRHYVSDDTEQGEQDYAPFLAAIAHALLGLRPAPPEPPKAERYIHEPHEPAEACITIRGDTIVVLRGGACAEVDGHA